MLCDGAVGELFRFSILFAYGKYLHWRARTYLTGYILGEMQLLDPLKFGLLWSFYKAVIGLLICSLGIIFAYYVKEPVSDVLSALRPDFFRKLYNRRYRFSQVQFYYYICPQPP